MFSSDTGAIPEASYGGRLRDWVIRVQPGLDFTTLSQSTRAKSSAYYPVLIPANESLLYFMLPKVGIVLVKSVPLSSKLLLSSVLPESHSSKNVGTLNCVVWPTLQLQ
jgi:hypothetical protein